MRILIVEDEKKVAGFIKKGLEEETYAVDVAYDGEEGLLLADTNQYDLIVLDLMLPKMGGLEVLTQLRDKRVNTPILLLTAKDSVEDKVTGLNKGADDYLTKPFAFSELLARVRSLLRRGQAETQTVLQVSDLTLDLISHKVNRNGEEIELTGKEYSLLEYFMRNVGKVLTRTMIAEHVWDYNFDTFTNVIDVYINHLRKKIDKSHEQKLLHTLRGVGYVMKES
ncbi:MAG: response regulator transcription factor [Candidatus Nitronauta litoralis]|uniref:Response regulator transcription factor n=1 Tax=Candidatus Nitronauta litoralis TaxID=2705533 RepID=A0A7T0G164_9BACT|nr:MAG: response regulator transcription factor [Candidatus Nitronauta litoralis]